VGWREGLAGRSYEGVCRGRNEDAFLHAFNLGTDIHRLQARIDNNAREINRLERQLSDASKDDVRRELRQRIRSLDFEQSRLRSSLNMLQSNAPRF
jgi:predicted  nucleic acid-binding Zn-ribbon protein